ncbi:hypothetical protein [Thalassotalea hakodatensis]|uniref:hypothetical protein n=1 Tax=Thalassotalea hakodatensis TaxID=3030492 RepID=UPI0025723E2D|nr:hypothetical protein [Thalassotalea hakodatensis]
MKYIIFSILVTLTLVGCKTSQAIYNTKASVPVNINNETMKKSIIDALLYKRWRVLKTNDNNIIAGIDVRDHYAEIKITYNNSDYSIDYQNSDNLDYSSSKNKIHRNYNKWIKLLAAEIERNALLANR